MYEKPNHYKEDFFIIYNYNGISILYYTIRNINNFEYKIKQYIQQNNYKNFKLYLIYHYDNKLEFEFIKDIYENIILIHSKTNFELFFHLHLLRHNYFYTNKLNNILINEQKILDIYDKINVPLMNFNEKKCNMYNRRDWLIPNYKNYLIKKQKIVDIIYYIDKLNEVSEYIRENKTIETIDYYKNLMEIMNELLENNISKFSEIMNLKDFSEIYSFDKSDHIYSTFYSKNIVLENVYYINKCWFDQYKNPLIIDEFNNDIEYKEYCICNHSNVIIKNISNLNIFKEIKEEVMFLDYIYGFYNFGEFWDVINRLIVSEKKDLPLFHLSYNRITNIEYYFEKLKFYFPTQYQTRENNKKLYYFHKINISTVVGMCRGYIDKFYAYHFNKVLNKQEKSENLYNLYLARGSYGRSIQNEKEIVNILKNKYNFIILNGSETLQETIHYFTNAKIILGAHGSLMKNMIWCKKNPVFIELCPYTRHDCFAANSINCGFTTFFFVTDCDEKEEVLLNDGQKEGLFELLDIFYK